MTIDAHVNNYGRHRAAAPANSPMPRSVLVVALLAAAVLGAAAFLTFTHTPLPGAQRAAVLASAPPTAAGEWIEANLPTDSRLLTDGVTAPVGYPTSSLPDAQDWHDFDYLLTTQTGTPSPDSAVAPIWPSSFPVALFDGLEVRHIVPETTPFDPAADRAQRERAGAELLTNPNLDVSTAARSALEAGDLDLRAIVVLTGLSSQFDCVLSEVTPVPAEAAAGTPARAITVVTLDAAQVMRHLDAFHPAFKPDRVSVGEYGAISLHWPLSFTPIPSVN